MKPEIVRAAMGRRRRMLEDSSDHDGGYPATDEGRQQSFYDMAILADAFLAKFPADGDEAVTEEWLQSVGAQEIYSDEHGDFIYVFESEHDSSEWRLVLERFDQDVWSAEIENGADWPDDIRVRGQVRDICRALGIPLTPAD